MMSMRRIWRRMRSKPRCEPKIALFRTPCISILPRNRTKKEAEIAGFQGYEKMIYDGLFYFLNGFCGQGGIAALAPQVEGEAGDLPVAVDLFYGRFVIAVDGPEVAVRSGVSVAGAPPARDV